ncbi:MAG: DegV family protein [Anaerolineales bacterium]|nr:DegV family protein [Anaerolineales bacterium]
MSKIALLTDSTANLPVELIVKHDIHVVPLKIQWGDDSLIDGVTISSDAFYARLETDPLIPTTSQPSMMDFLQMYEKLAADYDSILVMLIASGISGTVASATAAAAEFNTVPVEIVDTSTTSAGLAMVVLAAVRALAAGCDLAETAVRVRAVSDAMSLIFVVNTLKYLHRGGRIGGASRYLGTMLSIKPILAFKGTVEPVTRLRGMKKAMAHLVDMVVEQSGDEPLQVALLHSKAPDLAEQLQQMLASKLKMDQIYTFDLSPVIGTHVGTGAVGLAFYPTQVG